MPLQRDMPLFKSKKKELVGMDFGASSVKALVLKRSGEDFDVEEIAEIPTPSGAVQDHQIQDVEQLSDVTNQLRQQISKQFKEVATAVSGANVITKMLTMSGGLNERELENQIMVEAEHQIPFPLDEIAIDHEILGPNGDNSSRNDVLLSAARRDSISGLQSCIDGSSFNTRIVDVSGHALARGHLHCLKRTGYEPLGGTFAAVDIGAQVITFSVVSDGLTVYTRVHNFGGDTMTKGLANLLDLKPHEVEAKKRQGDLPEEAAPVLEGFIQGAIQQVRRNIQLYKSAGSYPDLELLSLSGGSGNLTKLEEELQSVIGINTVITNPFEGVQFNNDAQSDRYRTQGTSYMVAFGLAMREA